MQITDYKLKQIVWIHIGERTLVEGRIVKIITLQHLNEGHPDKPLYVIELKTGIEDIYEVRDFASISSDKNGPINLFRKHSINIEQRYLKKVGVILPIDNYQPVDEDDPTHDQINAALERTEQLNRHPPIPSQPKQTSNRRRFKKNKE